MPEGPGGIIICCENFLIYINLIGDQRSVPYPTRIGSPTDRALIINSFGSHKQKDMFFYLLQSELGDLFKLSFNYTGEKVHSLNLQYFDSIPVANSLCVLKSGYLFCASEFGNQYYNSYY